MLAELGGVATTARLLERVSRGDLEAGYGCGAVVRLARGRYTLPGADRASRTAHELCGVLSFRNAALVHGWAVKEVPDRPDVTIPQNRRTGPGQRRLATVHRAWLATEDVVEVGGVNVTSTDRTLTDCLRGLTLGEALSIADSALRADVAPGRLDVLTRGLRGPGSAAARRVAAEASPLASGPLESALRAIALDVPALRVRPQVPLWCQDIFLGRPDLVDDDLGIVLEADSFEWHGDRTSLASAARRYDEMVVAGWLVLRFSYEDVMGDPAWVRRILASAALKRRDRCGQCA